MKKLFFVILSFLFIIFNIFFVSAAFIDSNLVMLPTDSYLGLNYNLNNLEYVLYPSLKISNQIYLAKKYSYNYSGSRNWLTDKFCNLAYPNGKITANWQDSRLPNDNFYKNFRDFLKSYNPSGGVHEGNQILNTNLWMRANVVYTLVDSSGVQIATPLSPIIKTVLITDTGMVSFANPNSPYTISTNPFTLSNVQNALRNSPGIYNVKITATPTDLKCDFNRDGNLNGEITSKIIPNLISYTVFKDVDNDGWDDLGTTTSYLGTKGKDLCPTEGTTSTTGSFSLNILDGFQGCGTEYTRLGCSGIEFDGTKLICNGDFITYKNPLTNGELSSGFLPNRKTGKYSCYKNPWWFWRLWGATPDLKGSCELRYNALNSCTNTNGETLTEGFDRNFYPYKFILPSERNNFQRIKCITNQFLDFNTGSIVDFSIYKHSNPVILNHDYDDIIRNPDGTLTSNDNKNQGKISCPPDDLNCLIKIAGTPTDINLSKIDNSTTTKTYKIYKNGNLNRTQEVDSKLIALKAHKIKKFKTADESLNFINKSVTLMKKFDIVKNLTYNAGTDTTTVQIKTTNYIDSQIQNLTIYQIIDKSIAASSDNINFISDGGGQRFVIDKDPIIGWYFNDTSGSTTISYNVSGDNEGGTIIITQEPILFNEGELIINYRENKTGCSAGEVHLFDLNTLESSVIRDKNAGTYQVCITHLDSSITLLNGSSGSNILNISSYELNGNISSNFEKLTNKLQLSVNNDSIYWDLRIQKNNPDGNFSCLGSYDILSPQTSNPQPPSSLFGDCGYRPNNRIWMHLGTDYIAPTTSYSIPNLGHSVRVTLNAEDNIGGSGLNKTKYCVLGEFNNIDPNPCQAENNFKIYTNPFMLSCTTDWSCTRTLKYYSNDLAGNIEDTHSENLYLIDKGSACQADCTAKPSPNRYLKECRNLNSCFYAKSDGEIRDEIGKAVAEKCNFLVENSYVRYNATHEIKCPNGPFKLERFTDISTGIVAPNCRDLVKLPYPVIYDGQRIVMNILTCFDK